MASVKIVDGAVKYMLRTFDGSYVTGTMSEGDAKNLLAKAKEDGSVPGFELVSGDYRFETEQVVMKLRSSKKEKE